MTRKTNRREFVQVAGLAASGLMAAAGPVGPGRRARRPATTRSTLHSLIKANTGWT